MLVIGSAVLIAAGGLLFLLRLVLLRRRTRRSATRGPGSAPPPARPPPVPARRASEHTEAGSARTVLIDAGAATGLTHSGLTTTVVIDPGVSDTARTDPGITVANPTQRLYAGIAVLEGALREVAAVAPGVAIGEEIARLLEAGGGRDDLVLACIRYRDRLAERDPATGRRLLAVLREVGVDEIWADGEPFDTERHESVDVTAAPRGELHDRVAQTVRLGYRDGDRILRLPAVVVYRFPGADRSDRP